MKIFVGAVMAVACAQPVLACDFCAVNAATEAHGDSGKGFFAGLAEQYTYFDTFQSGGREQPNPDGEHLNSLISQAFIGYNINNRFGVQFNLPVIYREWSGGAEGGGRVQDSEWGLGDVLLIVFVWFFFFFLLVFLFFWFG